MIFNADDRKQGTARRYLCNRLSDNVNIYTLEVSMNGFFIKGTNIVTPYTEADCEMMMRTNSFPRMISAYFFNFQTWKWEEIWLVRCWNIIDSRAFFPFHRSTRFWRNARDVQSPTDRTGSSRIFIRCGQRRQEKTRRSTTLTSRSITIATPQLNIRRQLATHSIAISCCNTTDSATIKAISTHSPAHR